MSFVCLISREAINSPISDKKKGNIAKLTATSSCDNVVLEWRLAKELQEMGMIDDRIFPLLIGDKDPNSSVHSDYFSSGCGLNLSLLDVVITLVEVKLK